MKKAKKPVRIGTVLAFTTLILAFALAVYLKDANPFTASAPFVVGGKFMENYQERKRRNRDTEEQPWS